MNKKLSLNLIFDVVKCSHISDFLSSVLSTIRRIKNLSPYKINSQNHKFSQSAFQSVQ